ncbi:MAG: MMPL family transporter, partial [Gammaproteobacteria bacterium]
AGGHFDFVTAGLVPVVYVVGFAYAVHVVCAFERDYKGGPRAAAAARALLDVWPALALTALTTVIGFVALALSPVASIRTFGIFAACGIACAWLGAVTLVPAMLVLVPGPPRMLAGARSARAAHALAAFAGRHGGRALAAAAVLALLALAATTRLEVDTALLDNFAADAPVRRNFADLARDFAGAVPIEVVVEGEHVDALREPAALAALADLDAWLEREPGIGGAYGLVDYVRLLYRALAPQLAATDALPAARPYRHALLLAEADVLGRFVTADFRTTVIHLRTAALSTAAVDALAGRIEARLAALPRGLHGHVTGTTVLSARGVDAIGRGQLWSLGVALVALGTLLALVFRSPLVGAVVLLPSALPIVCFFGLLGLLPVTLNLSTSLVACAVFGIAIDDSVHLLARYAAACRQHAAGEAALAAALGTVLRPVTLTTAALVAGFTVFAWAELRGQAEFGLLAAATLLIAWLIDLAVTPALLTRLYPRIAHDVTS